MCGRFALDSGVNTLIEEFVQSTGRPADEWRPWEPSWNIKPTQDVVALFHDEAGPRAETARWSLVPFWSPELKLKFPTFNARAEGLAEKRTWRGPLKSHRTVIPASGYYEWCTDPDTKAKTPYYISHPDGPIGMAGLYSWWKAPGTEDWQLTATILTSSVVDGLVGIHDRNPVPLPRGLWDWWLDPTIAGDQRMVDDAVQAALPVAEELVLCEVAPLRGDGPELTRAV